VVCIVGTLKSEMDKEPKSGKISKFTFEEQQRLLGFFSILLKTDKRLHPEFYKANQDKKHESDNSSESVGQEAGFK